MLLNYTWSLKMNVSVVKTSRQLQYEARIRHLVNELRNKDTEIERLLTTVRANSEQVNISLFSLLWTWQAYLYRIIRRLFALKSFLTCIFVKTFCNVNTEFHSDERIGIDRPTVGLHYKTIIICRLQGRTGPPCNLALDRWAGWFSVQVGRHVKCWSRSNDLPW